MRRVFSPVDRELADALIGAVGRVLSIDDEELGLLSRVSVDGVSGGLTVEIEYRPGGPQTPGTLTPTQ